jgi:hypothetical protein
MTQLRKQIVECRERCDRQTATIVALTEFSKAIITDFRRVSGTLPEIVQAWLARTRSAKHVDSDECDSSSSDDEKATESQPTTESRESTESFAMTQLRKQIAELGEKFELQEADIITLTEFNKTLISEYENVTGTLPDAVRRWLPSMIPARKPDECDANFASESADDGEDFSFGT